jgi:arylsulfatase A-like enzyme
VSASCLALVLGALEAWTAEPYAIVDTGQERCYDDRREVEYPRAGGSFFGQDAQYVGNPPAYRDKGDGTVSDLVTGLMWQKDPGKKRTFLDAAGGASACRTGGHRDWRLPTIKELYSLIRFSGEDIDPNARDTSALKPFIDTRYFRFTYGDPAKGERAIDSQFATSTKYVSTTMHGNRTMFGVNFADGRIKGYPMDRGRRGVPKYYVLYVRGNTRYGRNDFRDNGDGTVTDRATRLVWAKVDSGHLKAGARKDGKLNWEEALSWAEGLEYAGRSDWRLPNAKELQSIVDYTRSPDTTRSAAIDPVFRVTPVRDGVGKVNYPFYWTSTTHKRMGGGEAAVYVAFGRSQGWMGGAFGGPELLDVHGAGSQRSDPKSGDPSRYPRGRGPQGDVIAIYNMVRPVRGGKATARLRGPELAPQSPSRRAPGPGGEGAGDPAGGGREFIRRNDRDGDGRVSRDEFRGPARAFDRNDRNRDGYLTEDEAPMRFRGGRPDGPGGGPGGGARGGENGGAPPAGAMVTAEETAAAAERARVRADAAWLGLPPSFAFILADDLGWTGLSVASDERLPESKSDFYVTPNVEKLAREGMRFSNAYAPAAMCTPTRASLLTGKSPAQLHMTTPGPAGRPVEDRKLIPPRHVSSLPAAETTIAEVLRQRNYATAHFGKWHLSGGGPGAHGFDKHDGETANSGPGDYGDPDPKNIFGVTNRAMGFMEDSVAAGRPFYVQLSHYAVHGPTRTLRSSEEIFGALPAGRRHGDAAYAGMTSDLDASVGMLLKKIERLGIASNTYVIFMSDNGAAGRPGGLENAPLAGGKATLYEGGIRVPLIVRGPGVRAGSSCHESVIGYDLFPTLSELAGVRGAKPAGVEGTSVVPLLKGRGGPGAFARSHDELVFHFPHYGQGPRQQPQSAIRVGSYKLVRDYETGVDQLFDLASDIGEKTDLASRMPEKRKDLAARLDAYLARTKAQLPTANPDYDPTKDAGQRRGRNQGRLRPGR